MMKRSQLEFVDICYLELIDQEGTQFHSNLRSKLFHDFLSLHQLDEY